MVDDLFGLDFCEGVVLEVLFEVAVAVLKDEVEFFVSGDDFFEVDDVGVFEDFEE